MPIESLPGLGDIRSKRLKDSYFYTVMDLSNATPMEIKEIAGFDELEDAVKLVSLAKDILIQKDVIGKSRMTGRELLAFRERRIEFLTTGAPKLDSLVLGGGIQTEAITEFFGLFGCGKTQMALTLSVICQLPKSKGGLDGSVIYIDTENTFRPNRILDIAVDRTGCTREEAEKYLDDIMVIKAFNSSHQIQIVNSLSHFMNDEANEKTRSLKKKPRLLIIDSLTAHFRTEYIGRGNLNPRQTKMGQMLRKILRTIETWKLACVITNQVLSSPDGNQFIDPIKPVGGNIVGHLSTYRVYIKRAGKKRIVTMIDSPEHAENSTLIELDVGGVKDATGT